MRTESEVNEETLQHIACVRNYLNAIIIELLTRGELHDLTKLVEPELGYLMAAPKLNTIKFGSPEYEASKAAMMPGLDHHYARNRHHPEHFENGINDMDLIDLIEMFVDWKASTLRMNAGNLEKSIERNAQKFKMSAQLTTIFKNTMKYLE